MVYSLVQSGLHCILLKMDNSLPTMLKCIKQQSTYGVSNTQKCYLHWNSLVITGFFEHEDTMDISTMHHWVQESSEGGRNVDLNDQPQCGMPVSTTQNLKRQKLTNLLKKINSEINVQPIKRLK
jgi:hypothetical protein